MAQSRHIAVSPASMKRHSQRYPPDDKTADRNELRRLVGSCLFLGIDEVAPSQALEGFLEDLQPGGVILFARNIKDAAQTSVLTRFLAGQGATPRLIGVDQEGGRVERLRPILGALQPAAALARRGPEAVREFGHLLGLSLRELGFHLNFAPVLDLSAPGATNLIGDRSFGTDPGQVATLGRAYLEGLAAAGIHGVTKHFPGLGPTGEDTHKSMTRALKDEGAFCREDLRPFQDTLNLTPAVMLSHAHYPFWDPQPRPASCSKRIVTGLLRDELGYQGVAISDDVEMGAVEGGGGTLRASASALAAGCDMLLVCTRRERMRAVRDYLVERLEKGDLAVGRVQEAAARVAALRSARTAPRSPRVASPQEELAQRFGLR